MLRQRWNLVLAAAAAAAALTGCTAGTVSGQAKPEIRDLDKIIVFNPCRGDLSDAALRSAGLDPATMNITTDAPTGVSTWRVCNWKPLDPRQHGTARLAVGLFSTSHTLYELRKKDGVAILGVTRVNKRQDLISKQLFDMESCYVSFDAIQGMFEVHVGWLSDEGTRIGDSCEHAQHFAEALEPHLPK
ncbi:DUF3558 domain-containing protein [Nocardia asteroides]|uniref:DUF3558 domain-containing protein n=1 Tax=Nocardia asteroides TaxID=1824 RepID=UPI0037C59597